MNGQQANGKYEVVFTLAGDHRDLGDNVLFPSNEIAVLNSSPATFDDLDLADDTKQIVFTNVSYDESNNKTDVTVEYNFDPGDNWNGGSLLAETRRPRVRALCYGPKVTSSPTARRATMKSLSRREASL